MIGGVVLFVVEMVFDVVSGGGGAVLRVDLDEELLLFFVEFGGNAALRTFSNCSFQSGLVGSFHTIV